MMVDRLLASALFYFIVLQNVNQVLLPRLPYALVALVCLLLTIYIWAMQDRECHNMEGLVAQKQQLASQESEQALSSSKTISGVESNAKVLSAISPKLVSAAIQDFSNVNNGTVIPPTSEDELKSQKPSTRTTGLVIGRVNDSGSVPSLGSDPTSGVKLPTSPLSSGITNVVQPIGTAPSISSSPNIAKPAITPSVSLTVSNIPASEVVDMGVQYHPAIVSPSIKDNVLSLPTPSSGGEALAKAPLGPVLPLATYNAQALRAVLSLPTGSNILSPGIVCGSLTSKAKENVLIAPPEPPQTHMTHARQRSGFVLSRPKDQRTTPNDTAGVTSVVTTINTGRDIDLPSAGAPIPGSEGPEEHEPIIAKKDRELTVRSRSRADCLPVSTSSQIAPVGEVTAQTIPSSFKQGPLAAAKVKRKSAPISVGSDSNDAMPRTSLSAKLTARPRPTPKQDSTASTGLSAGPKRIRMAERSPFDRALQAIRDASATIAHDAKDYGILPTADGKKNEIKSTSLNGEDIQTSKGTEVTVSPVPFRALPTEPRPSTTPRVKINPTSISEIVPPTQTITISSICDSKVKTPTLVATPDRVPSVASDRSNLKNHNHSLRPSALVLFDNSPSIIPSDFTSNNRELAASTTSRSRTKDAKPAVKSSVRSRQVRTAIQRTTSISSFAKNDPDITSNVVPLPRPHGSLSIGAQQPHDAVAPGILAVVNNSVQFTTATLFGSGARETPTNVEEAMTAPGCTNLGSEVKHVLEHVSGIVDPSVVDSPCPMLVDEPVLVRSMFAVQNDTVPMYHRDEQAPPLPLFSTPSNHTVVVPPLSPSPDSMSTASSVSAPPPFVVEHHLPTMSSFTFGINKCVPPVTVRSGDREALLSAEQAEDPQWSFHIPHITSPFSIWDMIDGAPAAPESNPWYNVKSMAPPQFRRVSPPPIPVTGPIEPHSISPKPKVPQWPYSQFMSLSSPSPSPSYSPCYVEGGLDSTAVPSLAPAASFTEPYTESPPADKNEMMMVVDDPTPIEERPCNTPNSLVKGMESVTSPSEARPKDTGVWKAPSLQKRVHFETTDNDTQPSQSHWNRDDSENLHPFGEPRESKRLKCATCDAHSASPFWGKENVRRAVKKRASKADLAEDWRLRRKPILLTARGAHAKFATVDGTPA